MNGPSDRELARWVRETLLFDAEDEPRDEAKARRMLAEVYRRHDADEEHRRRRRRRMFGVAGAGVLIVGGATAAAMLLRDGQPSVPEGGIGCRAAATLESDVFVEPPGQDPIEACRRVWESGGLPEQGGPGEAPELVACIDPVGGRINVFPGDAGLCAELSLEPADSELDASSQAVVDLQTRLTDEINLADCQPAAAVADQAEAILSESGLPGWQVVFVAEPETNMCAKAVVDSATRSINIIEVPGGNPTP